MPRHAPPSIRLGEPIGEVVRMRDFEQDKGEDVLWLSEKDKAASKILPDMGNVDMALGARRQEKGE